jgi:two-component system chemotaxis response regulator CheB
VRIVPSAVSAEETFAPALLGPIRVMVVDDSAVARGLVRRWVEEEPNLEIVASLRTGREAISYLDRTHPDVVVLDVDMPDMDGISALPLMLQKRPDLAVIMASTLTRRNAEITLKALALGALDYVQKPEANGVVSNPEFRRDLLAKIREFGARSRRVAMRNGTAPAVEARRAPEFSDPSIVPFEPVRRPEIRLRPFPKTMPRVLLIGSSTGGPQALTQLCTGLAPVIEQAPVLITQHMPPTFTTILAEHLSRAIDRPVREAEHGEHIRSGHIYIAPGARHMRVARRDNQAVIAIDDSPPVNFCKPAVDVLFSSAADVWGAWVLGLILTGMGADGTRGSADIVAAGGAIIAQDEATSVVWGMPGSAAAAGLCSAILPIEQIAPKLVRLFTAGDRA